MLLLSVFFVRTDKLQTSFWDHFCRRREASACLTVSARSPARWRLSRWWEDLLLLRWKKAHLSTFTITAPLILMEGRLAYTHAHTLSASALLGLVWSNSHGFLTLLMSLVRVRVQVAFAGCAATCRSPPHRSDNTHFSALLCIYVKPKRCRGKRTLNFTYTELPLYCVRKPIGGFYEWVAALIPPPPRVRSCSVWEFSMWILRLCGFSLKPWLRKVVCLCGPVTLTAKKAVIESRWCVWHLTG